MGMKAAPAFNVPMLATMYSGQVSMYRPTGSSGRYSPMPEVGGQGIRCLVQLCIGCLLGADDQCRVVGSLRRLSLEKLM